MVRQITRIAAGVEEGFSAAGDELNPRALLRALWRRKALVIGTVALSTVLAIAFVLSATPLYRSQTLVRIQSSKPMVVELPEIGGAFEADASTIESEIELLDSRAFAGRIVDSLDLVEDPEFNTSLDPERLPFWKRLDLEIAFAGGGSQLSLRSRGAGASGADLRARRWNRRTPENHRGVS